MREALTEMIAADVNDPRVHAPTLLTVTQGRAQRRSWRSRTSTSRSSATTRPRTPRSKACSKAAGFLRGPLGRRLGLQHAPELRFLLDPSIDMSEKLAAIVREDEERARAAGREPAGRGPSRREDDGIAERSAPSDRRRSQPSDVATALERACDKLRESQRILLTSHRRPDGDGTGSMAGLASLLRAQRQGSGRSTRSIRSRAATAGCRW